MNKQHQLLLENIKKSISNIVPNKKIGVAFSGGVDSTLLAKILSDLGYEIVLLTIGFANSHDVKFATEVNQILDYEHQIYEIDPTNFSTITTKIKQIIQTDNLSWNENCIAFYYVAKLANSLGIDTVVTANGIDELFCGYNAYRDAISEGPEKVLEIMEKKIENETKMMKAVNMVTSEFNVSFLQPLLSPMFIDFAKTIPLTEKIHSSEDLIRKHIIRKLASEIGIPKLSYTKRKKALQYGSQIHKALIRSK